jgi:hypothetical protein
MPSDVYHTYINISSEAAIFSISTPLMLSLMYLINKEYQKNPEKKNMKIREWLVYLTLFIAGMTLAIDMMILFYYFFDGREIVPRFILKILSVFLVAGSIFIYFILDINEKIKPNTKKIIGLVIILITLSTLTAVFMLIGTPEEIRKRRIDDQRIFDLMSLQSSIVYFWELNQKLPENITELKSLSYIYIPKDDYEYIIKSNTTFEICANFYYSNIGGQTSYEWQHGEGRYCFERDIEKILPKAKQD